MSIFKNIWNKIRSKKDNGVDSNIPNITREEEKDMSCKNTFYEEGNGFMCDLTKSNCPYLKPNKETCDIMGKRIVEVQIEEDAIPNNKNNPKIRYTTLNKCFFLRAKKRHYKLNINIKRIEEIING